MLDSVRDDRISKCLNFLWQTRREEDNHSQVTCTVHVNCYVTGGQ